METKNLSIIDKKEVLENAPEEKASKAFKDSLKQTLVVFLTTVSFLLFGVLLSIIESKENMSNKLLVLGLVIVFIALYVLLNKKAKQKKEVI